MSKRIKRRLRLQQQNQEKRREAPLVYGVVDERLRSGGEWDKEDWKVMCFLNDVRDVRDGELEKLPRLECLCFERESMVKRLAVCFGAGAGLMSVCVPASVECICKSCFLNCRSLCNLVFERGSNLKVIETHAFTGTNLVSVRIPASVEVLGCGCFSECANLQCVLFEEQSRLTRIDPEVLLLSSVGDITIPSGCTFIGRSCFWGCASLFRVSFEENCQLAVIETFAFARTNMFYFAMPKTVGQIGICVFPYGCVVSLPEESKFDAISREWFHKA